MDYQRVTPPWVDEAEDAYALWNFLVEGVHFCEHPATPATPSRTSRASSRPPPTDEIVACEMLDLIKLGKQEVKSCSELDFLLAIPKEYMPNESAASSEPIQSHARRTRALLHTHSCTETPTDTCVQLLASACTLLHTHSHA